MEKLVLKLQRDFGAFRFEKASVAHWSPRTSCVYYTNKKTPDAQWTLLHELGHGILGHDSYDSDMDLLYKEVEAWKEAKLLAERYRLAIDEAYVEKCLDSYRDWLHRRSICPACHGHGLQQSLHEYRCFNCKNTWSVSLHRHCRTYRLQTKK